MAAVPGTGPLRRRLLFSIPLIIAAAPALGMAQDKPRTLATVDGVAIVDADVEKLVGPVTWPLEKRLFDVRQQAVEALIKQRLLEREAARRGVSLQALIDAEVTAKTGSITEDAIDAAVRRGAPAGTREEIRAALLKERVAELLGRFVSTLENKSTVRMLMEPPRAPRATLESAQAPSKGDASAPITIVEFTDFHCTYCQQAEAVLRTISARYPIRFVHRDLPIDSAHPQARDAHEAARCAADQAAFWPFRELLFAGTPKKGLNELKSLAEQARLDVTKFERCLAAGTHRAAVQQDIADAKRLGVSTTPTFFVNGREIEGPATIDAFVAAIERDLPRQPRTK
jgi:protein-disulfide isomerase